MTTEFIADKDFKGIDFSEKELPKGEYENCIFLNCNLSNSDLSEISFADCLFNNCDLSLSKTRNTTFRDVRFKNTKLLGLHFEDCNQFLFSVNFETCQLNLSSFFKLNLKNTYFKECNLTEVDFAESNLTNSIFENCNLDRAIFENSILEKANFKTAYNFSIDPENNKLKKAKFSKENIAGLLYKYNIIIE